MATTRPQAGLPDPIQTEVDFSLGIVRDRARHTIPPGGVYNATDFMLEKPGLAYKRGGWLRHSAVLGANTSVAAVATLHAPTRVVAVGGNGTLYNVTSESGPEAVSVGSCPTPAENPPLYPGDTDKLIFCYPDSSLPPKKVYTTGALGTVTLADLGGSPPPAGRSTVYASRIVLGRGFPDSATAEFQNLNRLWFSPYPDEESTWDTTNSYIDCTTEIIGLCEVSGVLAIFGVNKIERILNGVPPGVEGENMILQPVASVGCLDARSIVRRGNDVIFAGEEGIFITNMSGTQSLIEKGDKTGITSYWHSLFPAGTIRQIIGGLLYQDYYIVSVLGTSNESIDTLICHIPTLCWTRATNIASRMYAQGRTEEEALDLYWAAADEGYVNKLRTILVPSSTYKNDGDGTAVTPVLETRPLRAGDGLNEYGHAHITYDMRDAASDNPTLVVTTAPGLNAATYTAVPESPLAETAEMVRKRVSLNTESTFLSLKFTQANASSKTEIALVEADVRQYGRQGDTSGING